RCFPMRCWYSCCCCGRMACSANGSVHEGALFAVARAGVLCLVGGGRARDRSLLAKPAYAGLLLCVHGHDLESDDDGGPALAGARAFSGARRLFDSGAVADLWMESLARDRR